VIRPPRALTANEIESLLGADVPARLATVDQQGFPHVTPLWFVWSDGSFYLTSFPDRAHLRRLRRNPRAGICIDVEQPERDDGERPNRQIRAIGDAELFADEHGVWTRRITRKYVKGEMASAREEQRAAQPRTVIRLAPVRIVAVASV
jgi:nitroimidazol reductase NimA-like FMN-containing flavoprotein (pyridoxamine 5'-phosphate oxidase superfamily)